MYFLGLYLVDCVDKVALTTGELSGTLKIFPEQYPFTQLCKIGNPFLVVCFNYAAVHLQCLGGCFKYEERL